MTFFRASWSRKEPGDPAPNPQGPAGGKPRRSGVGHAAMKTGSIQTDGAAAWLEDLLEGTDPPGVGSRILARDPGELARLETAELVAEFGLAHASARRVQAAFSLGRAWLRARQPKRPSLRSPRAVFELLEIEVRGLEQETFWSLLLDGKHRLRRVVQVSVGTLTASLVHPREVFRCAVREAAAALIVAHNHPSGDPEPSAEDLQVTERLRAAGEILGIPLQDHVILGDACFVSMRERLRFAAS
jgi:DNA repair protein RadC